MATSKRQTANATARLRRMYIDCRYVQLHLTTAYPASERRVDLASTGKPTKTEGWPHPASSRVRFERVGRLNE